MAEMTQLLNAIDQGDPHAAAHLLPLVHDELRRLAAARLAAESSGNTLQATALVHEAYFPLVGSSSGDHWDHRGHFYAAAAEAMRRILIDQARQKTTARRGGLAERLFMGHCTSNASTKSVRPVHGAHRVVPKWASVWIEQLSVLH
jgi:RNA polymerase sigma factor (TIGR02999 family)